MRQTIRIHPQDNVAVALVPLPAGARVDDVTLRDDIPPGHKFALRPIPAGGAVIKYGYPIGAAAVDVPAGAHVHVHNVESTLKGDLASRPFDGNHGKLLLPAGAAWRGYRRADGRVGSRNEIWVLNTVGCVNKTCERIAAAAHARFAGKGGVDGVYAFPHPYGCSQLGDGLGHTRAVLAGLINHPNAGGVLVVGLGCETNQMKGLLDLAGADGSGRVKYFNAQDVADEHEEGMRAMEELVAVASRATRETVSARELVVGLKCGGSDGLSGITANPTVGRVADRLAAEGGTGLLTEVTEMFGAEDMLLANADSPEVHSAIVKMCNEFRQYLRDNGQEIDQNPAPGNKAGGLSTNADKSLGCCQKAGAAPIRGVLGYGQPARGGLAGIGLVNCPSNDAVSCTALSAAGAHVILFTTGRGTPLGFPTPTLKISTSTDLATRKPSWIDFDAGRAAADATIDDLGAELWELVLATASGQPARHELNGIREIAIWKVGATY